MRKYNTWSYFPITLVLVGLLTLTSCKSYYVLENTEDQTYRFNHQITDYDPVIDSIIAPYKNQLDGAMNAIIGENLVSMRKEQPESLLGNWVADAIRNKSVELGHDIDFALQNYGGLRIGELPKGVLKMGQLYELMPFENYLIILNANGEDLMLFFERIAAYGGWPVSSEVRAVFKDGKPLSVSISGNDIVPEKKYRIALPDYIANGGDRCDFFKDNERINTGILIRDILIESIKAESANGQGITAKKEGRIIVQND